MKLIFRHEPSECVRAEIVPIWSSLCVLKGCKLMLFTSCLFLRIGPLNPTRKEIIVLCFSLRYSKTTSICKVVHPASTWCIRPSSVPARPNISNVAYSSVKIPLNHRTYFPVSARKLGTSFHYTDVVNQPWGTFTVNVLEKKHFIFCQTISKTK